MAFTEDLSLFFADFGVTAAFTRSSAPIATCTVIFDLPTQYLQMEQVQVASDGGVILCRTSDVTSVQRDDHVVIDGATFNVALIHDGGSGITRIDLEKY